MLETTALDSWDKAATLATFHNGSFATEFAGRELQKHEADLMRYREAVEISQPDLLIETGTRAGGSALWFHYELGLQVLTIDPSPGWGMKGPIDRPGVRSIRGSSIASDVFNEVLSWIDGYDVMVSLDSDHHSPHVQCEIALYGPLVSSGCYLVVEDACFDLFDGDERRRGGYHIPEIGGPLDAIRKAGLEANSKWTRDTHLESAYKVSHSPAGWWRRND